MADADGSTGAAGANEAEAPADILFAQLPTEEQDAAAAPRPAPAIPTDPMADLPREDADLCGRLDRHNDLATLGALTTDPDERRKVAAELHTVLTGIYPTVDPLDLIVMARAAIALATYRLWCDRARPTLKGKAERFATADGRGWGLRVTEPVKAGDFVAVFPADGFDFPTPEGGRTVYWLPAFNYQLDALARDQFEYGMQLCRVDRTQHKLCGFTVATIYAAVHINHPRLQKTSLDPGANAIWVNDLAVEMDPTTGGPKGWGDMVADGLPSQDRVNALHAEYHLASHERNNVMSVPINDTCMGLRAAKDLPAGTEIGFGYSTLYWLQRMRGWDNDDDIDALKALAMNAITAFATHPRFREIVDRVKAIVDMPQ